MSTTIAPHTETLRRVAALHGDAGVLSVYVDARPERKPHQRPGWEVALRAGLADARRAFLVDHPEMADRVDAHLETLRESIAALTDPKETGRGRALFSVIGGATIGPVSTQGVFPDEVVLDDVAYVAPLLVAADAARPAGVAVVSAGELWLLEIRDTAADHVAHYAFDDQASEWRDLRGPAGGGRGTVESVSQRDLFDERRKRHHERWLGTMATRVAEIAGERGWDATMVLAEPAVANALIGRAPGMHGVPVRHGLQVGTPHEITGQVRSELASIRQRAHAELVTSVVDAALAGGRGAIGWHDVETVLAEGRVHRLLVDPIRAASSRPSDATAPGIDHLIATAVRTDAEVVPVTEDAARLLEPQGGLAAVLRW